MKVSNTTPMEGEQPSPEEIANLAFKFYLDNDCQKGHEYENWQCAEHMLEQKKMIERQIEAIHQREPSCAGK